MQANIGLTLYNMALFGPTVGVTCTSVGTESQNRLSWRDEASTPSHCCQLDDETVPILSTLTAQLPLRGCDLEANLEGAEGPVTTGRGAPGPANLLATLCRSSYNPTDKPVAHAQHAAHIVLPAYRGRQHRPWGPRGMSKSRRA